MAKESMKSAWSKRECVKYAEKKKKALKRSWRL
jgi:hypothetical protein